MEDLFLKAVINEITWQQVVATVLLVWLTQIGTWVVKQLWNWFRHRSQPNLHDFRAHQKYQDIFSQTVTDFLRTHNFANPYRRDILDRIDEAYFYARFSSPEFLFHDNKLQKARNEMHASLDAFWKRLNHETFSLDSNIEFSNVPIRQNDLEQEQRDKIINDLNQLATGLIKSLDTFNKACLQKFDQKITITDSSPPQD